MLWVGHLDANKDPLTVLDGRQRRGAQRLPGLQLWCCFATAPLLTTSSASSQATRGCATACTCSGRVPHARIEPLMRAADLFVLGSHREGSSFSLIEALAWHCRRS